MDEVMDPSSKVDFRNKKYIPGKFHQIWDTSHEQIEL
jgi:hypothetical protein